MKRAIFLLATPFLLGSLTVACSDDGSRIIDPPPPPPTGLLTIVTSTTGTHLVVGLEGYRCRIDGNEGDVEVGLNGSHVHALAAGNHLVEMTNVPANCEVQGENPRMVTVVDGGSTLVEFEINCW